MANRKPRWQRTLPPALSVDAAGFAMEPQPYVESPGEYQAVHITLSNGRRGVFTGAVLVRPGEEGELRITDIAFGPPATLPPGTTWGTIDTTEKETEK